MSKNDQDYLCILSKPSKRSRPFLNTSRLSYNPIHFSRNEIFPNSYTSYYIFSPV